MKPLIERHEQDSEQRNENMEHMEEKLGSQVLRTSLDEWDDQKEYNEAPEQRMEGIKLALMVLRRAGRRGPEEPLPQQQPTSRGTKMPSGMKTSQEEGTQRTFLMEDRTMTPRKTRNGKQQRG